MEEANTGIYHKSIQSGKWFLIGVLIQKSLNMTTFFVLARLLVPADFGILAILLIVTGFTDSISSPGFGSALLQKKGCVEDYLDTVWTFDLFRSIIIAAIIFLASSFIGSFFNLDPSLNVLIKASSLFIIISAFSNSRMLYFFKNLDYHKIVIRDVISQLAYSLMAIGWVLFVGRTVWALFFGHLARCAIAVTSTYFLYPVKPKINFQFYRLKELWGYAKWIYGQNMLDYLLVKIDSIIVGRLLNSTFLGYYSKAKELPSILSGTFSSIMRKIGLSAYVKVQDRFEKIQEGFIKTLDVVLFASVPLSLLLILEGGTIIYVLLGQQWLSIVVPLKIFSVGAIFAGLVGIVYPLFNAIGKPRLNFEINLVQLIISAPMIYLGLKFAGIKGAAAVNVAIWFCMLVFVIYKTRPVLRMGREKFLPTIFSFASATAFTFLVGLFGRNLVHSFSNNLINIGWVVFLGLFFLLVIWATSRRYRTGPWSTIVAILKELRAGG